MAYHPKKTARFHSFIAAIVTVLVHLVLVGSIFLSSQKNIEEYLPTIIKDWLEIESAQPPAQSDAELPRV